MFSVENALKTSLSLLSHYREVMIEYTKYIRDIQKTRKSVFNVVPSMWEWK